ncbi:MAG: glycosyltransferase family 2 protein [Opitutae bacterium]|nr:glycosyltransferase family 2 protein [Opitutae bacterium]
MLFTVFTPAYNRAYIIGKLYESLCTQTLRDFEWLVVDDGSTDNTSQLIAEFSRQNKIAIRYIRQENGGKHRAINRGVKEARGELFFIVDSDDYLTNNALERLAFHYGEVKGDPSFCGVSGLRKFPDGRKIGGEENWKILDCTSLEFRYKFNSRGDAAEAYKRSVLKEFPFPEFPGERFCAESLVWNRIAQKFKLRYFYEKIYVCEYRNDGLTASSVRLRRSSPTYSTTIYSELLCFRGVPVKIKLRSAINFWRFAFIKFPKFEGIPKTRGFFSILGIIPGFLMFMRDRNTLKK